ncbi:MAG: acetyltransferase [Nitrospira sp.]|nr:acetyltransferase [Nitrospira sp.]
MSKPRLIVIGAGGHAHACIDVIERCGLYEIIGLVGLPDEMKTEHLGYVVMAIDSALPGLAKDCHHAIIAVGQIHSPAVRVRLYQRAIELGLQLPTIVSPTAYVSRHAAIGAGSIVMHGAIINAGARIGSNCIINTRAIIEHDVTVADHCHISTGAILNGNVKVGQGSFVGSGTVIKEGVSIGSNCIMGMGLAVWHNQTDTARLTGSRTS